MSDPEISIQPNTLWCPKHLEPFRKHWPHGYMPASMCLFNQVIDSEAALERTGGDATKINAYLAEFGPFCCQFEGILEDLYEFANPNTSRDRFKEILRKYSFPPPGGWRD